MSSPIHRPARISSSIDGATRMETFTWPNLIEPMPGISSGMIWNPARYLPGSMSVGDPDGVAEGADHLDAHREEAPFEIEPLDVRRLVQAACPEPGDLLRRRGARPDGLQLSDHPVRLRRDPVEADPDAHVRSALVVADPPSTSR